MQGIKHHMDLNSKRKFPTFDGVIVNFIIVSGGASQLSPLRVFIRLLIYRYQNMD